MTHKKIRILIAKPDLDGHDRGAKVVALAMRDAGMEVIYTGLHQSLDQILAAAIQESVDIIGLSIMTGGHLPICRKLFTRMRQENLDDIHVVVGGVIGLVLAFVLARLNRGVLMGIAPWDPVTLVGVPLLLLGVALVAALIPARRASRVSPVEALRSE